MIESEKINVRIWGTEYTLYAQSEICGVMSEPCENCGAAPKDQESGDNHVSEYMILSMLDEFGNDVGKSHPAFMEAEQRLHRLFGHKKPMCEDCYQNLDTDLLSDGAD